MSPTANPATAAARVRVTRSMLVHGLQALGQRRLRHTRDSARGLIRLMGTFSARGVTPLGAAIGDGVPEAWRQYARDDVRIRRAGHLFYYYHSHTHGLRAEHGHFHVFRSLVARRQGGRPQYAHLVGIGVDARGLPVRLFTTNRWVTDECWRDARDGVAALTRVVSLRRPARSALEGWLRGILIIFLPQIAWLLQRRDQRVAAHGGVRVLEDHRMHVLSECRVSLGTQMAALDAVVC